MTIIYWRNPWQNAPGHGYQTDVERFRDYYCRDFLPSESVWIVPGTVVA